MTDKLTDSRPERILALGVEGGGQTFYRRKIATDRWEFWEQWSSMDMDENDDEIWRSRKSELVYSIEKVMPQLGTEWVMYYPIFIHPNYRELIRAEIERLVSLQTKSNIEYWHQYQERHWHEALDPNNTEAL